MEVVLNDVNIGSLKHLNLCVFNSKITAIIGDNASGKSIIGEIIATIRKPNGGKIIVDKNVIDFESDNIDYNKLRFDIGMVIQNTDNSFFERKVEEHISYQLRVYNYKPTKKRIIDSLKMVNLGSEYLNRKINTLSDSERFKVALATTLSINPKLLILDDPTCFLDEKLKDELIKLLKMMKYKYNKTILILSNDTDFLLRLADYIYVIHNNKILLHGNKFEVLKSTKLENTNIHIPDIIRFQMKFEKKGKIKIDYRDNINDLVKDIYYYLEKYGDKK